RAYLRQILSKPAASATNHVTLSALCLAPEQRFTTFGVSTIDSRRPVKAPQIGNNVRNLRVVELLGGHVGTGDSLQNDRCKVSVGTASQLGEIGTAIALRIKIVAPGALRSINLQSSFDSGRAVIDRSLQN